MFSDNLLCILTNGFSERKKKVFYVASIFNNFIQWRGRGKGTEKEEEEGEEGNEEEEDGEK